MVPTNSDKDDFLVTYNVVLPEFVVQSFNTIVSVYLQQQPTRPEVSCPFVLHLVSENCINIYLPMCRSLSTALLYCLSVADEWTFFQSFRISSMSAVSIGSYCSQLACVFPYETRITALDFLDKFLKLPESVPHGNHS